MRETLKSQLMEEIRAVRANLNSIKLGIGDDAAMMEIDREFDDAEEIKANQEQYFEQLTAFYEDITEKLIVFDPLDRPTPIDNDQAIKQKDLTALIQNMKGVLGNLLENPLNYEQTMRMKDL